MITKVEIKIYRPVLLGHVIFNRDPKLWPFKESNGAYLKEVPLKEEENR